MLGYEYEMDWYGLEMVVDEELMEGKKLPVVIVKELSEKFQCEKSVVQLAVYNFQEFIRRMDWCEKKGHKWVDDSYGGPESGAMAAHCTRCGYSFHHQLY